MGLTMYIHLETKGMCHQECLIQRKEIAEIKVGGKMRDKKNHTYNIISAPFFKKSVKEKILNPEGNTKHKVVCLLLVG